MSTDDDIDADVSAAAEYPTLSGLTEESVFGLCTEVVVNSSVAKKCGRFFDRDIMHAIDMCVLGELNNALTSCSLRHRKI